MRISFDLDGTLYAHPKAFNTLYVALTQAGHTVGLLTGHNSADREEDVARLTGLGFGPWDFFEYTNTANNVPATIAAKIQYLIDHAIDIHFDDMAEPIIQGLRARNHQTTVIFKSML